MPLARNIPLLTWFNFWTDFRLYSAIAILYFAQVTGSYALGMSIFSITFVSAALFEVPTGVISDRVGRRKTLIFGALSAVAYAVFYALASVPGVQALGLTYASLAIGALLEGLSRSFYSGNNTALLHDTLTQTGREEEYSEQLGRTSAMFQVALAVSAVIGGFLAEWSFALIMWLSVIPQVFCVILAWQVVEPKVHVDPHAGNVYSHLREALRGFVRNPRLRLLTLSNAWGYAFGEAVYQFQAAFYALLWPVWAIGLAKTLSNILAAGSFVYAGRVVKRFGAVNTWLGGATYSRIACLVAGLFPGVLSPLLVSSTSVMFGFQRVAKDTLFQKEFSPHQRATMGSLAAFAGNLLFGVVSLVLGVLADAVNPVTAFVVMQVLMLPTLWWMWRVGRG